MLYSSKYWLSALIPSETTRRWDVWLAQYAPRPTYSGDFTIGKIVAVGTTSIRTLETIGTKFNGEIKADSGWTDIFITPGYEFKVVEAFSTNFHLPKSTLVMLVSAFAGRELTLYAYQHAIDERYRFFSFGDAMFVK